MPKRKLTKTVAGAARPETVPYELRDTVIPGFLLKGTPFIGSKEQIIEDIRTYQRLGVSHLIFDFAGSSAEAIVEQLHRFAEGIRPQFGVRP